MRMRPSAVGGATAAAAKGRLADRARVPLPSIAEVAAALRDLFGEKLTAQIAGAEEPTVVDEWARRARQPDPASARRLREAWRVAEYLLHEEDRETVQAWFVGLNPELGDRVPVLAVADDPEAVMSAARVFVAYG